MGAYKIKDIEVLTGIKAHTLRIWEQRYKILVPDRTDTKIRTYSDSDLRVLLSISLLNNSGYKISKIAKLNTVEIQLECANIPLEKSLGLSIDKFIIALIEMDEHLFREVLDSLVDFKGIVRTFSEDLIPFLERIGIMWITDSINPAQEHFICNLMRQKIISEIEKLPTPINKTNSVLLYLPENELHEMSLLIYNYLIREKGIYTYYLGQSVPLPCLVDCIQLLKPSHIVTSWIINTSSQDVSDYFTKFSEAIDAQIHAGGYQVTLHSDSIPTSILQYKNSEELMSKILA